MSKKEPVVIDKRPTYDDSPAKPFTGTPLGDYIVVKRIPEAEGIIIKADIAKEKPVECEVIAVSPSVPLAPVTWYDSQTGQVYSGKGEPLLQKGDKVLIRRYSGTEVEIDKVEYTLILIHDVLLKL